MANMQDHFRALKAKGYRPSNSRRITLQRVEEVVRAMGVNDPNCAGAIFALLDDRLPNYYGPARARRKMFSAGASTAQIGCHVGILQRGVAKLDREGRDYWIKPLREVGAIEACYCDPETGAFLAGHPKAKSPNNAYRLDSGFIDVLAAANWRPALSQYLDRTQVGRRLNVQAQAAAAVAKTVSSDHADLIEHCTTIYAPQFLPGYRVLYVDDGDGDRVTEEQRAELRAAGVVLSLEDSYPDVMLIHDEKKTLWFVEAVTSDGEVDQQKVEGCRRIAAKAKLAIGGLTTAYPDWKTAAGRQSRMRNIAPGTFVWILEDAGRQFRVEDLPERHAGG